MNTLIFPILAFSLAVGLGIVRNYWIYVETKSGMWNVPVLWRSRTFQIGSWIAVALLSIFGALELSVFFDIFLPDLIADFLFGVILVIRWLISALIGHSLGEKYLIRCGWQNLMDEAEKGFLAGRDIKDQLNRVKKFLKRRKPMDKLNQKENGKS